MEWTPEIVRARFVEACDTERRLPPALRKQKVGLWPEYAHSFEDMNGWGTERLAEERELRFKGSPPTSAAITRHDEVMRWNTEILLNARHRHIVWGWARCRMRGSSFAAYCRRRGMVKITAYRHLNAAVERIVQTLFKCGTPLGLPEDRWLSLEIQAVAPANPVAARLLEVPQLQ